MRFSILSSFITLALLVSITALEPGDIPANVAVRRLPNGEIEHFYERDAVQYYKKRALDAEALVEASMKKRQDPESDTYPVSNDGSGLKAFKSTQAK